MSAISKIQLISLLLDAPENGFSLFSYWDTTLICRFMNGPELNPGDAIGKLHLNDFLGSFYAEALPYVNGALNGKIQTRQQQFITPSGLKTINATYIPGYSDGKIEGLYIYVSEMKEIPDAISGHRGKKIDITNISTTRDYLDDVAATLRTSILSDFPGINELSKKHFISSSKLKRDFKNKYNKTPFAYYRQLQMEYAHQYISQGICNKKQMSLMLNFSNPSNFSVVYRNYLSQNSPESSPIEINSYEIYKKFIEHAPLAMALLDPDLEFLAASEPWISRFNLDGATLTGRHLYDAIPDIDPKVKAGIQSCTTSMNDHLSPFSIKINAQKTQWKIWSFLSPPGTIPDTRGILLIIDELAAPGSAGKSQDESHEIHVKTLRLLKIGSWTRDLINNTTYWSPALKEMLEVPESFSPDLETAMNFYKEGASREKAKKGLYETRKYGTTFDIKLEMVTAKGKTIPVRVVGFSEFKNGVCVRISGVTQQLSH